MTGSSAESRAPDHFERIYATAPDPWNYATSAYEREKYARTLAALPRERYRRALEIGCSIGVLTAQLATRCDALLSIDVAERALAEARIRCAALPHVEFARLQVPQAFPEGRFDLIVVSEVGYYWSQADLQRACRQIVDRLEPGGHLLLVHFTGEADDFAISGDAVHDAFLAWTGERMRVAHGTPAVAPNGASAPAAPPNDAALRHLGGWRERHGALGYRLDLFARR